MRIKINLKLFIISIILGLIIVLLINLFLKNGIQITKENFKEEILRQELIKYDKDSNGYLNNKEIKKITKLKIKKLQPRDILDIIENELLPKYTLNDFLFDFKGIEKLIYLEELSIDMQDGEYFYDKNTKEILAKTANIEEIYKLPRLKKLSLSEIDIKNIEINQFKKLENIYLNKIYNLESLTPNNSNIKTIWLSGNNKLTSIDLSNLNRLKNVNIVSNLNLKILKLSKDITNLNIVSSPKLNELNLKELLNLKSLNLTDIGIDKIDVSNNTKLEKITCENLSLNTLDLTNNLLITYIINDKSSFNNIILSDKNIVNMIRWTNTTITKFPINNLNPNTLEGIDIQGTQIKILDVRKYKNLSILYYDKNTTIIKE